MHLVFRLLWIPSLTALCIFTESMTLRLLLLALFVGVAVAAVVELNSESYPQVTGDASKVVFVKVYADWCGHCQALVGPYKEVGEHFAGNDKVVIAKFNAPDNEDYARNVLQIRSFPTLFFYKNGQKQDFSGERTKSGIVSFIESNL